jgi:hypothetical protein
VLVDATLHKPGDQMTFLYPTNHGITTVERAPDGSLFVQLNLEGQQFVILE